MQFFNVRSSSIKAIGYDEALMVMDVVFTSDSVYRYTDIPKELFVSFLNASSIGRFYTSFIKGRPNTRIR